jgi:hypothetical protein
MFHVDLFFREFAAEELLCESPGGGFGALVRHNQDHEQLIVGERLELTVGAGQAHPMEHIRDVMKHRRTAKAGGGYETL